MKKLLLSTLLISLLSACASQDVKDDAAKPAVEDRSVSQPASGTAASGAQTAGAQQGKTGVNPLTDPGNILSKRSVYFDYDSAEVTGEYRPLVEAHAKYLLDNANAKVTVQGNTDERGSREYNIALGQRRADSVKKIMSVLGVSDKQIETVSFGEEKPRATCPDESCFKENRRADIVYQGE